MTHACTIEVIRTISTEGRGTEDDPVRDVTRFHDRDGTLLASSDPDGEPGVRYVHEGSDADLTAARARIGELEHLVTLQRTAADERDEARAQLAEALRKLEQERAARAASDRQRDELQWRPVVLAACRYAGCVWSGTHSETESCGRRDALVAAVAALRADPHAEPAKDGGGS